MGDVSAHSSAWGSRVTYARGVKNGNVILNFVMEHNLTILNNGMTSRFTRAGIHSVPDVVFCSQQLALETDFKIFQDRNNSDHFHI